MMADELLARRQELRAKRREELKLKEQGIGNAEALAIVEEELLDVNAKLDALTPGKHSGRKKGPSPMGYASDLQQFRAWASEDQDSTEDGAQGSRSIMQEVLAERRNLVTERQLTMLELWGAGLSKRGVAAQLGIDSSTASRLINRAKESVAYVASKRSLIHNDAEGAYFDMADPRTFVTIMSGITVTQFTYLYLYFGAYLSFSKIAALLGCNRSTVCRGINRAVYRVLYGLPDGLIRMKNMDVLGDAAYQFCTQYSDLNTVLEKMPYFVQRSRQGVWAARKSRPKFLVTQDGSIVAATIDTHGNSKIATTVRGLQRTENLQRTGFGELLKVLLRRRRGEEDKSVLLEWLNRIFVAYKEKLKKVVHIIV